MFARLLVGLDGTIQADVALEQAMVLGRRFGGTVIVAYVREPGAAPAAGLTDRARFRVAAGGLPVDAVEREGEADLVLAELAKDADAVLVGRRSATSGGTLGRTAASLVRIAQRCVVVCGAAPSPMRACAVAFDGRDDGRRALELGARFAAASGSQLHVIHANDDPADARRAIGLAEATLSLERVRYHTHVRAGRPAEVVAALVRETGADAVFAGAHVHRGGAGRPSPVVVSNAEEILARTTIPVVVQP